MTSIEDPDPPKHPLPPTPGPHPDSADRGRASPRLSTAPGPAPAAGRPGRLWSRVVGLGGGLDPLSLAGGAGFVWIGPGGALVGVGVAARIPVGTGAGRIERAAEAAATLLGGIETDGGPGPAAVGSLPFHPGAPGELVVPELLVRCDRDGGTWVTVTGPTPAAPPSAADLLARLRAADEDRAWPAARRLDTATAGLAGWRSAVAAALGAIAAGRLDKVVLAREAEVRADRPFPLAELLRRLRARSGGSTFLYASDGLVGASPELLVRRRGRVAVSRPMAGTVPRGTTAAAEADGLARLTGSPKEAVEHRLVVDAVAEGLAKVADRVQVAQPEVVRLATVAHLATEVTADLTEPVPTALELAGLLHPTPAVGGSPRDAALAAIAVLEPFDRGRYAGPVGWVDRDGDGEWAVALRCATLAGRRARLLAGAGIVPGSDPDEEWAETEHKLRAMLEVLLDPA
jgi:menaquinone-specific isochorismate synthase